MSVPSILSLLFIKMIPGSGEFSTVTHPRVLLEMTIMLRLLLGQHNGTNQQTPEETKIFLSLHSLLAVNSEFVQKMRNLLALEAAVQQTDLLSRLLRYFQFKT